jgi:hypothetical protein
LVGDGVRGNENEGFRSDEECEDGAILLGEVKEEGSKFNG